MQVQQLAVSPKVGFAMIGVGVTKGYELINEGALDTFKIGRATRITTESIERFITNQLSARKAA